MLTSPIVVGACRVSARTASAALMKVGSVPSSLSGSGRGVFGAERRFVAKDVLHHFVQDLGLDRLLYEVPGAFCSAVMMFSW